MNSGWRRVVVRLLAVGLVILVGALLRGWLVPAHRGDLSPEAYGWRLRLPWANKATVTVYFPIPEGDAWVAVRRVVPAGTPLAVVREVVAGPAPDSELGRPLPASARVGRVDVADGVATVQIDGWEPNPASAEAALALEAMARSLQGSASAVKVVTGAGRTLGPVAALAPRAVVTYLWRGLPVPLAVDLPSGPDRIAAAVRRLLTGPAPVGIDAMPDGVSLVGVQVKGDLARVSLSLTPGLIAELTAGRWQFAPHAMAMVYTLTNQPAIRRVQFDFLNLPPEARRNCRTPLGVPLVRPEAEQARAKGD